MAKFKELDACLPQRLLYNVTISAGARNSGEEMISRKKTTAKGYAYRDRRESFAVRSYKFSRVFFLYY